MIDHIGLTVTDIEKSRAFYEAALRPLGFSVLKIATASDTESGGTAVMFGIDHVEFVIADNERVGQSRRGRSSMPSTRQRSRPAGGTMGRPGFGVDTARPIMQLSCMIPTGSMSRRCATPRCSYFERRSVSDGVSPNRRR
jgi:catechol 2,3-dioxygenase-like lactoylglutathione lyase family enzyme